MISLKIRAGFNLAFDSNAETPLLLMVHIRPERQCDLIEPEKLTVYPEIPLSTYTDTFGNICTRLIAPAGRLSIWNRFLIADSGNPEKLPVRDRQHPIRELPDEVLIFLLGSRYCDTQKLSNLAWSLFGGYQEGWPRIQAILQYAHDKSSSAIPMLGLTEPPGMRMRNGPASAVTSHILRLPCAAA